MLRAFARYVVSAHSLQSSRPSSPIPVYNIINILPTIHIARQASILHSLPSVISDFEENNNSLCSLAIIRGTRCVTFYGRIQYLYSLRLCYKRRRDRPMRHNLATQVCHVLLFSIYTLSGYAITEEHKQANAKRFGYYLQIIRNVTISQSGRVSCRDVKLLSGKCI